MVASGRALPFATGPRQPESDTRVTGRFMARVSPSTPASFAPTPTAPTLLLVKSAPRVRSRPTGCSLVTGPQSQPRYGDVA
jgi:hypothetical protein